MGSVGRSVDLSGCWAGRYVGLAKRLLKEACLRASDVGGIVVVTSTSTGMTAFHVPFVFCVFFSHFFTFFSCCFFFLRLFKTLARVSYAWLFGFVYGASRSIGLSGDRAGRWVGRLGRLVGRSASRTAGRSFRSVDWSIGLSRGSVSRSIGRL